MSAGRNGTINQSLSLQSHRKSNNPHGPRHRSTAREPPASAGTGSRFTSRVAPNRQSAATPDGDVLRRRDVRARRLRPEGCLWCPLRLRASLRSRSESDRLCPLQQCSLSEAAVAGSRPPSPGSTFRRPGAAAAALRPGPRTTTWWWSAEGTRARRRPPRPRGAAPELCSSLTGWTRSVRGTAAAELGVGRRLRITSPLPLPVPGVGLLFPPPALVGILGPVVLARFGSRGIRGPGQNSGSGWAAATDYAAAAAAADKHSCLEDGGEGREGDALGKPGRGVGASENTLLADSF